MQRALRCMVAAAAWSRRRCSTQSAAAASHMAAVSRVRRRAAPDHFASARSTVHACGITRGKYVGCVCEWGACGVAPCCMGTHLTHGPTLAALEATLGLCLSRPPRLLLTGPPRGFELGAPLRICGALSLLLLSSPRFHRLLAAPAPRQLALGGGACREVHTAAAVPAGERRGRLLPQSRKAQVVEVFDLRHRVGVGPRVPVAQRPRVQAQQDDADARVHCDKGWR